MARPTKENSRKTIFGKKLDDIRGNVILTEFCKYFDVQPSTYSKYLNGDNTPPMGKMWEFVLRYAAEHNAQRLDLNWLMNDNDRRPGPVFIGDVPSKQNDSVAIKTALKFPPMTDIPGPKGVQYSFAGNRILTRGLAAGGMRAMNTDDFGEPRIMPNGLLGVPVYGDSMSPVILHGQLALIDAEREGFEKDDGIYVVSVLEPDPQDERTEPIVGTFVKRCQRDEDTYYLKSVNDVYSPFPVYIDHCRIWPVLGTWFDDKGSPPDGF